MISLLPDKDEILPITENWSTFYESGFNNSFDNLSFKAKLQVIADIVRQTILYDEFPEPCSELITLKGDSYTASNTLCHYLKRLGIGDNCRCVLARDSVFNSNPLSDAHFITLVDYEDKTYQVDCSPTTGYKCGVVEDINVDRFYNTYIELSEKDISNLDFIRTILYRLNNFNDEDTFLKIHLNILDGFPKNDVLISYIFKCLECLYEHCDDDKLKHEILCRYIKILVENTEEKFVKNGIVFANEETYKQIENLKDELDTLISEDKDYKRQLEIAQCIVAELIKYNKQYDKKLKLNSSSISFTNINPRFFLENGLNVVLLKPSSFRSDVAPIIKESYLGNNCHTIGEYYPNLGMPSSVLGLKPMRLFHPYGYKYERSMYGPGDLFLVKDKADNIRTTKKKLRSTLARDLDNTKLMWYDGEEIVWDPVILNLVHTTDDPSEASLHYLAGYPEYQLMTRFMYPNPKLKVLEKEN